MQIPLNLVLAYLLTLLGHLPVKWALLGLRRIAGQPDKPAPLDLFIGSTERLVVTTMVIWTPRYVPAFIGAWMAFKIAANWQRVPNSSMARQGTLIGLLGNVYSFAIAIGAGLLANPEALRIWSDAK